MNAQIQIIEKDGKPEYAVVPIDDYKRLLVLADDAEDIAAADVSMAVLDRGEDELIPADVVRRIILSDDHPLKVWREFRGLTQERQADKAGTTKSSISQIGAAKKAGSIPFFYCFL
ncbi:MAG: helix-turn-helix domain-containing protein [Candidatus Thiodiazotropha sp. (ex Troendleina suluensis)]|nr:helix-turn-helix domain-containing protein [Candidatus Thiodiazotropha sp. (ex Troendleina suluensis)]